MLNIAIRNQYHCYRKKNITRFIANYRTPHYVCLDWVMCHCFKGIEFPSRVIAPMHIYAAICLIIRTFMKYIDVIFDSGRYRCKLVYFACLQSKLNVNYFVILHHTSSIFQTNINRSIFFQLLNDRNDDDDIEAKAGIKKPSELLQQLLKKDSDDDDEKKNENGPHEDVLLKTLGFPSGSPGGDRRGAKRSMDDKDDRDSKRSNNGSQVRQFSWGGFLSNYFHLRV